MKIAPDLSPNIVNEWRRRASRYAAGYISEIEETTLSPNEKGERLIALFKQISSATDHLTQNFAPDQFWKRRNDEKTPQEIEALLRGSIEAVEMGRLVCREISKLHLVNGSVVTFLDCLKQQAGHRKSLNIVFNTLRQHAQGTTRLSSTPQQKVADAPSLRYVPH